MQRLTRLLSRRLAGHPERGAAAIVLSLLMIPLIGFAAIAVDIGAVYAERARLQVAADAAALAVAQDCAHGNCGNMAATAGALVAANDTRAGTAPPVLQNNPMRVTVTGSDPVQHWFAPLIGHDSTRVSATATVAWGAPDSGTAVLPLTFSWCEFSQQTGGGLPSGTTVRTIYFTKTSNTVGCTGPSHNIVPGGFAYLDTPAGTCTAASARNQRSYSSTGNTPPNTCSPTYIASWVGRTVLLPLFDDSGGTGANAWYHVYGYAAFKVTGFAFGGQFSTSPRPCSGNGRCIAGYFTRLVDLSDAFSYSPDSPDLGASVLRLIR